MAYSDDNIVSEKFWLNLAGESIQSSFDKRSASSVKLKAVIQWVIGLFTTSGFVLSIFKDVSKFSCPTLWLLGIGFALLTIAYAMAGVAEYPVTKTFHPNDTEEIAASFSSAVKKQSFYFQAASIITMTAFTLIAIAILLLFRTKESKVIPPLPPDAYPLHTAASISKRADSSYAIALTALTLPATPVEITVEGSKEKASVLKYEELAGFPLITDTSGKVYGSIKVPGGYESYRLQLGITITNKDTVIQKSKSIKLSKP